MPVKRNDNAQGGGRNSIDSGRKLRASNMSTATRQRPPPALNRSLALKSSLYIWRDRFVFASPSFIGEESARPSIVLLIGIDHDIEVITRTQALRARAFLIAAGSIRSVTATEAGLYSLNLDPVNSACAYLREQILKKADVVSLDDRLHETAIYLAAKTVRGKQSCEEVYRSSQRVLDSIFPQAFGMPPIDGRITLAAEWLRTHRPIRLPLDTLSNLCGVSPSRLSHLFKQEVGFSLRQYLLWVKMRTAAEMFIRKQSLAEVAQATGFADSAHLSRTFTRYFALRPSFLSNSQLVDIQICDAYLR